jgi:hypothetical protein
MFGFYIKQKRLLFITDEKQSLIISIVRSYYNSSNPFVFLTPSALS